MNDKNNAMQEWLDEVKNKIIELQVFSKMEIPQDPEEVSRSLSKIYGYLETAGELKAQAESFQRRMRAHETREALKNHKDLTGPERKVIVEDKLDGIIHICDILNVLCSTLHSLSWAFSKVNR